MIFKVKEIEKSKDIYVLYLRADVFNPFKEIDPNVSIPTFSFLPQIGVNLRRSKRYGVESIRVILGWFNAYAELDVIIYKKLTN